MERRGFTVASRSPQDTYLEATSNKQVRVGDVSLRARWTMELHRPARQPFIDNSTVPAELRFVIRAAATDAVVRRLRWRCREPEAVTVTLGPFVGRAYCTVRRVGKSVVLAGEAAGDWRHTKLEAQGSAV